LASPSDLADSEGVEHVAVYGLDAAMMEEEQVSRANAKISIEVAGQDNARWTGPWINGYCEGGFI
jgi:hypothetical protein